MHSLLAIKARLKAVENIKKITRAMQLVAAAKFKRSDERARASTPYSEALEGILRALACAARGVGEEVVRETAVELAFGAEEEPIEVEISRMFEQPGEPEPRKPVLVLVTSDRGMCGAFNTKLIRAALEFAKTRPDLRLATIGKRGYAYFKRRNIPILFHEERVSDALELPEMRRIARKLVVSFVTGEVDAVYVAYAHFRSVSASKVEVEKILSIPRTETEAPGDVYILEPDRRAVFETLLPLYATTKIYAILADSFVSEYGARMTAMQMATKNAGEMIDSLVIERNRMRQAAITKELSEIVGAAEAL